MKRANLQAMFVKLATVAVLAGTFAIASPGTAQAQQFGFGVQVGRSSAGFDHRFAEERMRREREARAEREARIEHEEWVRAHEFARFHRSFDGFRTPINFGR